MKIFVNPYIHANRTVHGKAAVCQLIWNHLSAKYIGRIYRNFNTRIYFLSKEVVDSETYSSIY